ncbi:MAG: dTDP-4-dehydrorhamnose 3,5-epimerase family protein [Stellaceae bacterium]
MRFIPTRLPVAFTIELDKREDERGFFVRFFCEREYGEAGLESHFVQIDNSLSEDRGSLRGMHYQLGGAAEVKIVRCLPGALWDAILALRPGSPTFGQSFGAELTGNNRRMMYVPGGRGRRLPQPRRPARCAALPRASTQKARARLPSGCGARFRAGWSWPSRPNSPTPCADQHRSSKP